MAFSFKWYPQATSGTTLDLSGNPPAAGDVGIAWSVSDSTSTTGTGPGTGWTQINTWQVNTADGQSLAVWIKNTAFAGGETSLDITTSTVNLNGAVAITGVDATTFQDVTAPSTANNNTGASSPATITNSITPVTNGALLFAVYGADTGNVDATFSFSDTGGLSWTTGADEHDGFRNVGVGVATQATAGATTVTGSATFASGTAGRSMFLLALRPAGGGGASRPVKMAGEWGGFAGPSGGFAG